MVCLKFSLRILLVGEIYLIVFSSLSQIIQRSMTRKSGIFPKLWRINFSLTLFEISVKEKFFPSQIFQKVWGKKLILHSFWKIQLFLVILSWIIYENVKKKIKNISLTKSIRRENVRHYFAIWKLEYEFFFHNQTTYR